jgi:hypothetical protein
MLQFSAAVAGTNSPSQEVTWSITTSGKHADTAISASGLLTVAPGETKDSLTIKAVSKADTSKSDTKTVVVVTANDGALIDYVYISGTEPFVGEVITATALDATGNVVTDAAFQWKRANDEDGTGAESITGATSATYTLAEADVGKYIAVEAKNAQTTTAVSTDWGGPVMERPYSIVITGIPAEVMAGAGGGAFVYLTTAGTTLADLMSEGADRLVALGYPLEEPSGSGPYTVTMALFTLGEVEDGNGGTYTIPSGAFRANGTYTVFVILLAEDEDEDEDEEGDEEGDSVPSAIYQSKTGVAVSGETTTVAFSAFDDVTPSGDWNVGVESALSFSGLTGESIPTGSR